MSASRITRAVVFTGGEGDAPFDASLDVDDHTLVVAADSGLMLAVRVGASVDVVVGDLDSVDPATLSTAVDAGAHVEQHPRAKDRTDLALALDLARAAGATEVLVIGGTGGRLDHLVGNIALLGSDEHRDLRIRARFEAALVTVIRSEADLRGRPGDLVSLIALGGPAEGVTTEGLAYPLRAETLAPGTSRGISNTFLEGSARVSVSSGVLAAIQPEAPPPAG